jgi:hypothetical protein
MLSASRATPMQDAANAPLDRLCQLAARKPAGIACQPTNARGKRSWSIGRTGIDCVPVPQHLRAVLVLLLRVLFRLYQPTDILQVAAPPMSMLPMLVADDVAATAAAVLDAMDIVILPISDIAILIEMALGVNDNGTGVCSVGG